MSAVNAALGSATDLLLLPFSGLHPLIGLTVISLLVAIGMLMVFKKTSNQSAIARTKEQIHAGVFEIRLFNDDLAQILRSQMTVLKHNAVYFGLSLVPLAVMIVPFVLIMAQLQMQYGYEGLEAGDEVLVKMELKDDWRDELAAGRDDRPPVSMNAPEGVKVATGPLWFPSKNEIAWEVVPETQGDFELGVDLAGTNYTKTLTVQDGVTRRSPIRHAGGFLDAVLWPAERPLPGGPVNAIRIHYPDTDMWFFGLRWHWLIIFFVLSLVFAFALKDRFGVTI